MAVTKVLDQIWCIEVPLPKNPLKYLNAYFIRGKERNLLIDTGFNLPACREALLSGLEELGVSMETTDIFLTHMHSDHTGLVEAVKSRTSTVWASEKDAGVIRVAGSDDFWGELEQLWIKLGFHEDSHTHPGRKFAANGNFPMEILGEGDEVNVGDYRFQVLHTPGHTKGHLCLYEKDQKILISGDTILADITPNISIGVGNLNPLGDYFESLKRLESLRVEHTLTAHRRRPASLYERIRELRDHHGHRLEEALGIVRSGRGMTAAEAASKMHWDITSRTWEEFPPSQKWFAIGEAAAHLQLLAARGDIARREEKGYWIYEG